MTTDGNTTGARTMKASEFKAKCLKLMDEVADSGEEIVITKYGRPVSKLIPYRRKPRDLFGIDKGRIEIIGDIVSPMPAEWFEDSDDSRKKIVLILLDTHVIAWFRSGDRRLGPRVKQHISNALEQDSAAVSTISFWEVGMRLQKGQINVSLSLDAWRRGLIEDGLIEIPVDGGISARAGMLEDLHGDPADRIIVATALEGHRLVTADSRILDWPGPLDRMNAVE